MSISTKVIPLRRFALPFILALALTGCANSRTASFGQNPATLAELNRILDNHPGLIHLEDGRTIQGYDVEIRADSVLWMGSADSLSSQASVTTTAVQRIERQTRRRPFTGRFMGMLGVAAGCQIWRDASVCHFPPLLTVLLTAERMGELLVHKIAPMERTVIYRAPVKQYLP